MNILVLNPPFVKHFSREQRSAYAPRGGTLYFPLWLAWAAGMLERAGHTVKLVDCPAADIDLAGTLEIARELEPRMVIAATSAPSLAADINTLNALKEQQGGDVYTMLVGPHPTSIPELVLKAGGADLDAVAIGEYDYTVVEVADWLAGGGGLDELERIQGLGFLRDGGFVRTEARPLIPDLDELPMLSEVYWKQGLNIKHYRYNPCRWPHVMTRASRGCPHRCTFCLFPHTFSGRRVRYRSLEKVLDEMEFIQEHWPKAKEIMFEDDTFTISNKRMHAFAEGYRKRGLKIKWSTNARADVDYEVLKDLKNAGLRMLCVGFESGSQQMLDAMRKGITVERMRRFAADCKRTGVLFNAAFIIGTPGETVETIEASYRFARELPLYTVQWLPLSLYPGTAAFKQLIGEGRITSADMHELTSAEAGDMVSNAAGGNLTPQEIDYYCDKGFRMIYLSPRFLLGKFFRALVHWDEWSLIFPVGWKHLRYFFRNRFTPEGRKERRRNKEKVQAMERLAAERKAALAEERAEEGAGEHADEGGGAH